MALSDEQNAMLRLLASGEQGYEDIAALMGLSVDEVRAKVVGALAQLEAEGKPVPNVPPPLPGGSRPVPQAAPPAPEPTPEPPAEPATDELVAPPTETDAGRGEPRPPAATAPAPPPPPAPVGDPLRPAGRTITLPTGRRAWLWGGGALVAVAAIVVVVLLVSGGGGNGSSTTASEGAATAAEGGKAENAGAAKTPTEAELKAVDGSEAKGRATFGRYQKKLALAVEATGLEPTTEGKTSYTIWLRKSATKMLPLFSTAVKASGKGSNTIAGEYEVPVEVLAYLANETFDQLAITLTDNARLEASLEQAKKEKTTPSYTGTEVLRGTITGPIVGLAQREEEAKKEKGE